MTYQNPEPNFDDWNTPADTQAFNPTQPSAAQMQDGGAAWNAFQAPRDPQATYAAGGMAQQGPPVISQPPGMYQEPMPTYQMGVPSGAPMPQQPYPQQPQQFPPQQPAYPGVQQANPQYPGVMQANPQYPGLPQQPPYQPQYPGQQMQPAALTPEQYFGQMGYNAPAAPGQQMYPQPQYNPQQQPPYQYQPPQYGMPQQLDPYGYPIQPQMQGYGQPAFGQPNMGFSPGAQMYGSQPAPQQQPVNPLARYDTAAQEIQAKLAASQAALTHATVAGDAEAIGRLAAETAGFQGQLSSTMFQRGQAEQQYTQQMMHGVRTQLSSNYERMATGMLGMQLSEGDRREFNQYMDSVIIPGTEEAFAEPYVQQTFLKAYAFDKMMTQRAAGPVVNGARMAPSGAYTPGMQGTMGSYPRAGFPQGQPQQGGPIGFQALAPEQRTNFLSTGMVTAPRRY